MDHSVARAIKLKEHDALRMAQQQIALVNDDRLTGADERSFDVTGRICRAIYLMEKTTLIGPSQTVVVHQGDLLLGHSQGVMFFEFDGPRDRMVHVKVIAG